MDFIGYHQFSSENGEGRELEQYFNYWRDNFSLRYFFPIFEKRESKLEGHFSKFLKIELDLPGNLITFEKENVYKLLNAYKKISNSKYVTSIKLLEDLCRYVDKKHPSVRFNGMQANTFLGIELGKQTIIASNYYNTTTSHKFTVIMIDSKLIKGG
ncbi:MAG: hypothetical protein ABFS35_22475 [Bacteroidota bacterium]